MQLEHSFTVPVGVDEAWRVLLDIERVAPCMPGAALDSVDGDDFTGTVKVRVGPIGLTYKGKARFIEKDEEARRAVIDAQGKDARGNGTAAAKVSATLRPEGDSTRVEVVTDLNVTGKPAQFGRGVMADVGNKLIGQFADCLSGKLAGGAAPAPGGAATAQGKAAAPGGTAAPGEAAPAGTVPAGTATSAGAAAPAGTAAPVGTPAGASTAETATAGRAGQAPDVEPIDLLSSAGPAIAKRLAPVALLLLVVVLIVRRLRHA